MNHDWQQWVDRLKSPDLTAEERRAFEEALREDPAHVEAYLEALQAETALEAVDLPDPFLAPVQATAAKSFPVRRLALIAVGIALTSVAYLLGRQSAQPGAARAVASVSTQLDHLATITDADAVAEKSGIHIGQPLEKGLLAVPDNSKIGIAMRGGARLEVRGPADVHFESASRIRMREGRVKTYAPEYARGFTIDTNDGKVIDLGTRFVTAAGTPRGTEIHVLEGLVEAKPANAGTPQNVTGKNAAILQRGKLEPTEYLEQRLNVPLDPLLPDTDGDGIADAIEAQFGTDPRAASSVPEVLRVEESFIGYNPGTTRGVAYQGTGMETTTPWQGNGTFVANGLSYAGNGHTLKVAGGAIQTIGEWTTGAVLIPAARGLPRQGCIYISFLVQFPSIANLRGAFGGLLLYRKEREELFVGKIVTTNFLGSRFKLSDRHESTKLPADTATHLYVLRIDRTRLLTDVFVDPPLGQPESATTQLIRYYDVPEFDRIMVRSGCSSNNFAVVFDEIRAGLTWDSVLPLER